MDTSSRVSARPAKSGARRASRSRRKVPRERESQDVDEIIIIDDPVLQTINVRPSASRYFIFRGGRACASGKKRAPAHGSDFILNVMTLPQAFKRHSDRERIPSYCCKKWRRGRGGEGGRKKDRGNVPP